MMTYIVIFGSGETTEEASASHDVVFKALLDRCRERGLKLNKRKLCFKLSHILGSEGLQADPEKIQAIQNMPHPVVTYLSKFLPRLSTICEPLCRLTDSNSVFDWLPQLEDAFVSIKELITQAPALHYFDAKKSPSSATALTSALALSSPRMDSQLLMLLVH